MCGRFGQTGDTLKEIRKQIQLEINFSEALAKFKDNINTDIGNPAAIIFRGKEGIEADYGSFGYSPFWSKKMIYQFNARVEGSAGRGDDRVKLNEENDPNYAGPYKISEEGMFAKATREHRCLVPVSWFFEGPEKEKLSKPYKIERIDKKPFFIGGCHGFWKSPDSGDLINTFTIYTSAASALLQKVGHHRCPVLIPDRMAEAFLDPGFPLGEVEKLWHPFDSMDFQAWPVSPEVRKRNRDYSNNDPSLLEPIGEALRAA